MTQVTQRTGGTLFSWAIFPIAMFGSVALSLKVFETGGSETRALFLGLGFGYLVVIVAERLFPFVPAWNRNHGDIATDAAWGGTGFATGSLVGVASTAIGGYLGSLLSASFGSTLWPTTWPLLAQLVLAIVVVEFFHYWIHRFEHEWDWLWSVHATHHSAPRLYWLNALRFHFLDTALLNLGFVAPLVALGAPAPIFVLWIVASSVHGICQHANMQVRCGPLNWVFSMAELHRWHHSRLVRESNTNYGQNIILWDIIFGTRFLPSDRNPPEDIGIANLPAFPMNWWSQLLSPIRWKRIKDASKSAAEHPL
ncbi:sterol desaturase family protein [Myxococcota bacterium]|nr:sterol desaturase family protein [Myxococcota bacterium]